MKTIWKILLGCVAVGMLGLAAVSLGGYFWFQKNKEGLKTMGKEATEAGKAWGATHGRSQCLPEALRRLDSAGLFGEIGVKIFFRACLEHGIPEAGYFCEGVPPRGEILQSVTFALERCTAAGHPNSQPCSRVVQAIQEHCEEAARKHAGPPPEPGR